MGAVVVVEPGQITAAVEVLGRCGEQPGGGLVRPLYSDAWIEARSVLESMMRAAGLQVRGDAVGNLFGRLPGRDDSRTVLTGSHVDTVVLGGKYDGALGILAGIAALGALRAGSGVPATSLEVVALCEEEGSRFAADYLGTRAILGLLREQEPDELRDRDGVTLREAARAVGLDLSDLRSAVRGDLAAFLELHIEQGRTLVDEGTDLGVVESITGVVWLTVTVEGRTDHAGTTAMSDRRDALQGAAAMVQAVAGVAREQGHPAVATTGQLDVHPGGVNVVPGRVRFSVDVRHPDMAVLDAMVGRVRERCGQLAEEAGLGVEVQQPKTTPPHPMDPRLQEVLERSAQACGASWRRLPSGAGHDSQTMATRVPTAMLFVPSVEGRSHSPAELTSPEDCARGATVLATALHALAY